MSKRFKQLADTFNMNDLDNTTDTVVENEVDQEEVSITPSPEDLMSALRNAKDLDKQFSKMAVHDIHDEEMDELAQLAIDAHKSLQDLGMNVEIRHAGEIFSSSSQMLKIAVDAKNSKVDKKLRLMKLQLDKMKMDKQFAGNEPVDGTAIKLDRNELLKQLKGMNTDEG